MDREQLFQNLSELEKQLKGIKSATEHVNQVVAADRELVRAVNDFSKEASKLIESTRSNFEVEVKAVQKAAAGGLVNLDDYDSFRYFQRVLKDKGVIAELRKRGARDSRVVRRCRTETFEGVE